MVGGTRLRIYAYIESISLGLIPGDTILFLKLIANTSLETTPTLR